MVDYYSRFIEMSKLSRESSGEVVNRMKSIMARHGVSEVVVSDNRPQLEFKHIASQCGFEHKTSSPHFPQASGEAERAVKTIKQLLKKAEDVYQYLLVYQATPLQNGYSPAELLMNRCLRTTLPTTRSQRQPSIPDLVSERGSSEAKTEGKLPHLLLMLCFVA